MPVFSSFTKLAFSFVHTGILFFFFLFFPTVDGTSFYTGTKHRFSRVPLMMLNMFLGNQRNLFLALLKLLSTLLNVVLGRLIGVKH